MGYTTVALSEKEKRSPESCANLGQTNSPAYWPILGERMVVVMAGGHTKSEKVPGHAEQTPRVGSLAFIRTHSSAEAREHGVGRRAGASTRGFHHVVVEASRDLAAYISAYI